MRGNNQSVQSLAGELLTQIKKILRPAKSGSRAAGNPQSQKSDRGRIQGGRIIFGRHPCNQPAVFHRADEQARVDISWNDSRPTLAPGKDGRPAVEAEL